MSEMGMMGWKIDWPNATFVVH